jgi:hypothetical protein
MSVTLSGEARARLDKHLDAVEAALVAAGNSREQRRGVLDDLEAQILDMLAAKSRTPTAEDVEAVLAQLDPPAAYIPNAAPSIAPPKISAPSPVVRPRYSRTAIWGLVCIIGSLFLPLVIAVPLFFFHGYYHSLPSPKPRSVTISSEEPERIAPVAGDTRAPVVQNPSASAPAASPPAEPATFERHSSPVGGIYSALSCIACFIGPLGLLGTVLGWIAFAQIRASRGALRGKGLALFDGLFYPCLAILAIIVYLLSEPHVTYTHHVTTRATVSAIVIPPSD